MGSGLGGAGEEGRSLVSDVLNLSFFRGARLVVTGLLRLIAIALRVGRPQREVVPQQLHDEGGVLVRILVERVQLGYRIIECLRNNRVSD